MRARVFTKEASLEQGHGTHFENSSSFQSDSSCFAVSIRESARFLYVFMWHINVHFVEIQVKTLVFIHNLEVCSQIWQLDPEKYPGIICSKSKAYLFFKSLVCLIYFPAPSEQWKLFLNAVRHSRLLHNSTSALLMGFRKLYVPSNV